MNNIIRQIAPCRFTTEDYSLKPIKFNFTAHFKRIIQNEVWNRAYDYGHSENLKSVEPEEFKKITVTIYPKLFSGYVDQVNHLTTIAKHCGEIEESFLARNTSELNANVGLIIIELELNREINDMIQTNEDYSSGFVLEFHKINAVLKEISAFLLAGLNLLFPTNSWLMDDEDPIRDGFLQLQSKGKEYLVKHKTGKFTHQILIKNDNDGFENLDFVFGMLSETWHKNLWSLRRYLIAVESSKITMDNFLDLMYALEGMFKKNTSSDFIKLMVCVQFSDSRKQATELKSFLDTAFLMRNEMVHGGKTFDQIDKAKVNGEEILVSRLYWEMKRIIATLIIRALPKLIENKEQMSLCYTIDDMWDKIYKPARPKKSKKL